MSKCISPYRSGLVAALIAAAVAAPAAGQTRGGGNIFDRRDEWQRVSAIIAALGKVDGRRIADIAAGTGYLTRHLAKAVGRSGRVYAVEIGAKELEALRALARDSGFTNVEVVTGETTDAHLPDALDGAVILDSYHELADYRAMLGAIWRSLAPGALLVLVDNAPFEGWHSESRAFQASHHALDPSFASAELTAAGFQIARRDDAFITQPVEQWLIVARRP